MGKGLESILHVRSSIIAGKEWWNHLVLGGDVIRSTARDLSQPSDNSIAAMYLNDSVTYTITAA